MEAVLPYVNLEQWGPASTPSPSASPTDVPYHSITRIWDLEFLRGVGVGEGGRAKWEVVVVGEGRAEQRVLIPKCLPLGGPLRDGETEA